MIAAMISVPPVLPLAEKATPIPPPQNDELSGVVAMTRSGEPGKNSAADFYIRGVSSFKGVLQSLNRC